MPPKFHGHGLCHADDAGIGCAVHCGVAQTYPCIGGAIQNGAATLLNHIGYRMSAAVEGTLHFDGGLAVIIPFCQGEQSTGFRNGGVVDYNINAAVFCNDFFHHLTDGVIIRHVAEHGFCLSAKGLDLPGCGFGIAHHGKPGRLFFPGKLLGRLHVFHGTAIVGDDDGFFPGKIHGDSFTDSLPRSGDQRNLSFERVHR